MITVLAILKAKPGKESELASTCSHLAKEVRAKEAQCLMYTAHVSPKEPGEIVIMEKYQDKDALKAHQESGYFQAANLKFRDLLGEPAQIKVLQELE